MNSQLKISTYVIVRSARSHFLVCPVEHSQVFRNYLTFCGLGLSNAQLFELSIQEYKKNQVRRIETNAA